MTPFEKHMSGHFASLMAMQGAKEPGVPYALEGMIKSALQGTWNAAVDASAKITDQYGNVQIASDIRELKA
jgi:hypothetical protein